MKKLHLIVPSTFYKVKGKYYGSRVGFVNTLSKHFHIKIHAKIEEVESIDEVIFVPFSEDVHFENLFKTLNFWDFIKNYSFYKQKLLSLPKEDLYWTLYPFKGTSILLSWILRKRKLVIRVKSDTVAVHSSLHLMFADGFLKGLQRLILNPIKSLLYILVSKVIFKNNLVFYTANVVINKKDHINQHEIISCPALNDRPEIIKKGITHQICFVGGESKRKGLGVLLKALNESTFLKEKVTLNIIGMDSFKDRKNRELSGDLNVKFHGRVYERSRFYDLLAKNDILVMPSFAEKQGKVQLEAMSAGVVPICSDSGGTYMTVKNFYNGLLFKPADHKGLRDRIMLLYENEDLFEDLKKNGLEYVKDLSLEKQAKQIASTVNNFYGRH